MGIIKHTISSVKEFFESPLLPKRGWYVTKQGHIRRHSDRVNDQCLIAALEDVGTERWRETGDRFGMSDELKSVLVHAADYKSSALSSSTREVREEFMKKMGLRECLPDEQVVEQVVPEPAI